MAIAIPNKADLPNNENIIVGYAELISGRSKNGLYWVLPGGRKVTSKRYATGYAERLNKMITSNMKRLDRNLLWS